MSNEKINDNESLTYSEPPYSPSSSSDSPYNSDSSYEPDDKFDLSSEQLEELREAFETFDTEKTGEMETKNLKVAMRILGIEIKKDEIKNLLEQYEFDENENISFENFCRLMAIKMSERNLDEEFLKIFKLFDDDDTGKISFKNLKCVAKELGEEINDEQLHEMIEVADLNGDGEVDQDEFIQLLKRANFYT
ncbi:15329_t:CDS:2 [Entrophospora sp. SA101]|nr:15329_t:CDS:2 [Entrophospora sp. SA101]CAJ0823979.1 17767_t:CDS:2 [Entrophospora sp. SA101]CAJ0838531.1 11517_t:CDS:2 [Entrophospora sp. SA101]